MSIDEIFDCFGDLAATADLSFDEMSFDQLTDALANSGIDVSELSDAQIDRLLEANHGHDHAEVPEVSNHGNATGQPRFGWHPGPCGWCSSSGILYGKRCWHCNGTGIENKPN